MAQASPRRIVLASGSPRRAELARSEGWDIVILPPPEGAEIEAAPRGQAEPLEAFVTRLARAKAEAIIALGADGLVLACDTLSEVEGLPLGKPRDRDDARRMLRALSGRRHRVVSGVCLWPIDAPGQPGEPLTGHAESALLMPHLTESFITDYLETGLWEGKAGACGFQDGHVPLELVAGSPSNVVGLPLELVRELLDRLQKG
ncbi:MAG: Maf family protein [Planctomycetota bacterium]